MELKNGIIVSCTVVFLLSVYAPFCVAEEMVDIIRRVTHVLKPGVELSIDEDFNFQMFCRRGEPKNLFYYFRTATLRIVSSAEDIKLIKGAGPREVYTQYTESTKWLLWIANVLPWRVRDTNFPTFNTSCVGISTSRPYSAMVIIRPIDPWKILILAAGITLFFMAPKLSKSTLFFYSSGTFLGAVAAALVLLFIVTRFLPKGRGGYFAISVLWTVAFYFAGETWKRFEELLHERLPYIVMYLFSGALIAFLSCYRWGPPTHPRTVDIIRWALQIGGLVLVHLSSDLVEMSTAIMLIVIVYHNSNEWLKYQVERHWRRWFPPKAKLLTEDEYMEQARIETEKGLAELRKFCSSPESKPWKLVTRLRNPRRFSGFVEGTSHLSDNEILAYESDEDVVDDGDHYISRGLPQSAIVPVVPSPQPQDLLTDDEDSLNNLETDDED